MWFVSAEEPHGWDFAIRDAGTFPERQREAVDHGSSRLCIMGR